MSKPELTLRWELSDGMAHHPTYASVTLSYYYGLTVEIYRDGRVKIETKTGGGHGDPGAAVGPKPASWWTAHFEEAWRVARHYYGQSWGTA